MRLASNESPYPPLPEVREAIERGLATLNRYPDPASSLLRRRLSERYEVPSSRIAIGNGSCDILLAAGEALLEPGAELVYAWPSFSVYPHLSAASGARAVTVPLDGQGRHDLEGDAARDHRRNAPGGRVQPEQPHEHGAAARGDRGLRRAGAPARVRDRRRGLLRVQPARRSRRVDRAARSHPNLVLLRTFSKVHGLCGLRVGFALCGSEELPRALDQVRQPFFCNALAQAAATEALAHQDAVIERVTATVAERISVDEGLRALGLEPADSQANFCWFELGDERDESEILSGLAERGVLVRGGGALGSPVPALRVTYGLAEENRRFLDALAELL